ncbi:hypothetical protein, partial [Prochlorococcus sp. MIT 1303]|uniref:hypothetical protein n=1 Tax=Prochlorococcus sp. MIT 1303 TaxID=1723647 RepID=UPI000940954C
MAQIYPNPNKVGSTISFTDGDFNSANFDNHGTLINNGSGTFTNKSGIISNTGKFSSIDMNSGITNKSGATISNSGHFKFYALDNYSIINNNSGGTISLYGGGSLICQLDQCVINNNSGATFTIAEDWVAGGDHGEFDINGILNNNLGGTFNNNGNVSTERGDTAAGVINNNGTFNNNARLYNYYSTLTNNGIVNNKGIVENDMNGKFVNNSGATLNNIQSAQSGAYSALNVKSSFENSGTINNNATININGAGFVSKAGGLLNNHAFIYSDGIENAGTIFNYATININGAGKGITNVGFLSNTGNLTNKDINSRILINAGSLINKGTITNNGLIDLLSGSSGPGSFSNEKGALLTGTGSTYGHIDNDGTINGGQSAGGYLIDGNLMHNAGGNKIIELGGRDDAERDRINTEHDFVDITGDLILDGGSLDVSLIDGFKLSAGDSFVIAKVDGDLSGEYDGLNEGDSVGRFKSDKGSPRDLFITYQGGDGNDIELYTKSLF